MMCVLQVHAESNGHWAFEAIRNPKPPLRPEMEAASAIDGFVIHRLDHAGLALAAPASRRNWIRRLHVILIGLPPKPDELERWVQDPRSDHQLASTLVDRLLASPQYGIRWARFWLDMARYSDTKGYAYGVEQFDLYHAWRYRDWVVDAFNADMPYDHFVQCQIAADRLLEQNACAQSDLAAMGFLTGGRRFLGVEQDIIDDQIDVVTRTVLGLTAACARCHDHKFDPIPATDYYALYGVFKSSKEKLIALTAPPEDAELARLRQAFEECFFNEADAAETAFLERVDEYLIATLDLSTVPPPDFSEIVVPEAVVPAQIRRWHEYLSQSLMKTHPVYAPWRALKEASTNDYTRTLARIKPVTDPTVWGQLAKASLNSMSDVAKVYADLFQQAAAANAGLEWQTLHTVIRMPDSPLVINRDHPHDVEWLFTNNPQSAIKKAFASYERRIVALGERAGYTVALVDRAVPQNMRLLKRGDYLRPGEEVPRGGLSLLPFPPSVSKRSGRLTLARQLMEPTNPLTARVMVNRLWHHYFGAGLVRTTSDFGRRADAPSHPDLLDHLASHLQKNQWSLKSLHRLIATSKVFRQAAGQPPSMDPDNRLLSVYPHRRLDFESMRDALLAASGELDVHLGGVPSSLLGNAATPRRSLYGKIDRQFLPSELKAFDFANPELHSPRRFETNVPQQALFFLNSPFAMQRAQALAQTLEMNDPHARVHALFQRTYQRNPTLNEQYSSLSFIQRTPEEPWARLAHALLLANEFLFLD